MPRKAFIFDLDGVIIDSETWWDKLLSHYREGQRVGYSIKSGFEISRQKHPHLSWNQYFKVLNQTAAKIYPHAPLTPGLNQLLDKLIQNHYRLGLVSGSTTRWINLVIKRLNQPIPIRLSLHNHPKLKSKPAPDGYLTIMKQLQVKPSDTIILEDSQLGIDSAKASGAFTICLTALHPKNYHPIGADLYVKNIPELIARLDSI